MTEPLQRAANPGDAGNSNTGRRRRTLQSGFSLLARGEPKIWLTGGMLVICLSMVIGLLSLILISGLATFWPGSIHWLMLSSGEMDIGELQRSEVRPAGSSSAPEGSVQEAAEKKSPKALSEPSYFYRTANFDVTSRHYRWFEPAELTKDGVAKPQWALLIERMSWGRMMGLPSRLLSNARVEANAEFDELLALQTLVAELAGDLQTLSDANANDSSTNATPPTLDQINQAINEDIAKRTSVALSKQISNAIELKAESVLIQSNDGSPWIAFRGTPEEIASAARKALDENPQLFALRFAWDSPEQIISQCQRLIGGFDTQRRTIAAHMHAISKLDERLSEARVEVRQAELDTGLTLLEKVDEAGPLLDVLLSLEQTQRRVTSAITCAEKSIKDEALSKRLAALLRKHLDETVEPAIRTAKDDQALWEQSLESLPAEAREALIEYAQAYREVASKKQPIEASIARTLAAGTQDELNVLLPTDAVAVAFSEEDSQALMAGKWSEKAKAALQEQSITPTDDAPTITRFGDAIINVHFVDALKGSLELWGLKKDGVVEWHMPQQRAVACSEIVRLFPANQLGLVGKTAVYLSRWREFLLDDPREANTEGGVFPAIWGTVVMTLIMTLAVVPFGVIAALYLREYTRPGPIVSLVRISINNLAGVPSIVYGVFGLAFFCYSIGAFIDGGAKNAEFGALPTNTWYAVLAATVVAGVVAFLISMLGSGPESTQPTWMRVLKRVAPLIWLASLVGVGLLVFKSPFFSGFYEAKLPTPTFGKEGLLWASLTLALLTLPVVIVATEEALSAVPNSLREGSLACGASKWQTIYRIVLPHARPGILTGAILAMARGIGEVAPLMLVGALPVAPDLPLDSEFPYFHGSRSFMHLGYQIYWLGFQSQNSEASKPLVFTCTLLLILIVVSLNLSAILLRARLRRRFQGNQF